MTPARAFGLLLVGSELLTGKRRDRHLPRVIDLLADRGHELAWASIVGDDEARLVSLLKHSFASDDIVFSCGGIGATPDDLTRQCAAKAAGVELHAHPEALATIEARYGDAARPHRIRMAEFPAGSEIIPNPVNQVAGFSLNDHHFVPGFPEMAWPMIEWVLDNRYDENADGKTRVEYLLRVSGVAESDLVDHMQQVIEAYPEVRVSSLPSFKDRSIELGVRGPEAQARQAFAAIRAALESTAVRAEVVAGP